jgi:two-component system response regulator DesR
MSRTRVLCVDDDPATNRLHALLLGFEGDMEVVGAVADPAGVLPAVEAHRPDVVLLDVQLGPVRSSEVLRDLVRTYPSVRVLVLSGYDHPELVEELFAAGAAGFIAKSAEPEAIAPAIREAMHGARPRVGRSR